MREILFRGQRCGDRKWIQGSLIDLGGGSGVAYIVPLYPYASSLTILELVITYIEAVYRDTVCQYTGLKDRNGQRIFEGDILKIAQKSDDFGVYFDPPLEFKHNVIVTWDRYSWIWEFIAPDIAEPRYMHYPGAWCHCEAEVIGNIYDNPELLEVKQ